MENNHYLDLVKSIKYFRSEEPDIALRHSRWRMNLFANTRRRIIEKVVYKTGNLLDRYVASRQGKSPPKLPYQILWGRVLGVLFGISFFIAITGLLIYSFFDF